MAQIYGIDLASEKFDVSFVDNKGKIIHKVVKNTRPQIEKFLDTLPQGCRIVAEHTGVYGDMLLMLADMRSIPVSYVSGYEIKHSMGLTRGKSDPMDASRIREYGERHVDKLPETHFPSEALYKLRELYATRRLLVEQRKQLATMLEGDKKRPMTCDKAGSVKSETLAYLDSKILELEKVMDDIIGHDPELSKSSRIVQSIPGMGPVTTVQLIVKTGNFKRVKTAKKCATLAGIAPFPNSTGKSDKGNHVSRMGDKEMKSLLFLCARSASNCLNGMRLYKMKKYEIEKKHYFLVINNIANKLLKLIYSLINKGEMFNPAFVRLDPRNG